MIKISVNNIFGRIVFLLLSLGPILFYFIGYLIFNWSIQIGFGIAIYITASLGYFSVMFYYCCYDWDFFIFKKKEFMFERFGNQYYVPLTLNYSIKNIPIASSYFDVFLIEFENGKKFHFRYNIGRTPLFTSDRETIKKIESAISLQLK